MSISHASFQEESEALNKSSVTPTLQWETTQ
jgi:hypothetical protein